MTTDAAVPSPPPPPSLGPEPQPVPRAPAFPTAPPAPAPRLKDTSPLAIATGVLSGLLGLCFLAGSATTLWLVSEMSPGTTVDDAPVGVLGASFLASLLLVPVGLATWIVTGIWLMRVRDNAAQLSPTVQHKRGRGWGLWGWVTPLVNLWFPMQYVRDLRRATGAMFGDARVAWWWAAWVVALLASRIESSGYNGLLEGRDTGGTASAGAWLGMVATVISLALWLVLVRAIETGQAKQAADR